MRQQFFRLIADLRFSMCLLLVIAFSSIIGTVIEQNQSIETYKLLYPLNNPVFGFLSWDIILKFGFDHTYKTWWFLFFITLGQPIFGKAGGVGKVWEKMTIALARRMRTLRVIFKSKEGISSVDIGSNQS